jgi:hypothetical protein
LLVKAQAPDLKLMHELVDSWAGIELIVVGMAHRAFNEPGGDHGARR